MPADLPVTFTWTEMQEHVTDFFFLDPRTGWAAVHQGLLLKSTDGGTQWVRQTSPSLSEVELDRVHFFDEREGLVTGHAAGKAIVKRTTSGGERWTPVDLPPSQELLDLACFRQRCYLSTDASIFRIEAGSGRLEKVSDTPGLRYLAFVSDWSGWAIRDHTLLHSSNGGVTWSTELQEGKPLKGLAAIDDDHVWLALDDGTIRRRERGAWIPAVIDASRGGFHFSNVNDPAATVVPHDVLQFINTNVGWAVGGSVYETSDGGKSWKEIRGYEGYTFTAAWVFGSGQGVIAGTTGYVATTTDGKEWVDRTAEVVANGRPIVRSKKDDTLSDVPVKPLDLNKQLTIQQVLRPNERTVWVVGTTGDVMLGGKEYFFSTYDGGVHWRTEEIESERFFDAEMSLAGEDTIVITLKKFYEPTVLVGAAANHAPRVDHFAARESPLGGIDLEWTVRDDDGDPAETTALEYSLVSDKSFAPVDTDIDKVERPKYRSHWPAQGIPPGDLHFRVTVRDSKGLEYRQVIPRVYVYKSLWNRQPAGVKTAIIAIVAFLAYLLICMLLLAVAPLSLIAIEARVPPALLNPTGFPGPVKMGLTFATTLIAIERLVGSRRVVTAWLRLFAVDVKRLDTLSPTTRKLFLGHADVRAAWVVHYRAGRVTLAGLPPEVRAHYVDDPALLDAFVSRRIERAAATFRSMAFVQQRSIYVGLPVRIVDGVSETLVVSPEPMHFTPLFARDRALVEIAGQGGVGKSSLGVHLAEGLMSDDILLGHRAIGILLQEEVGTEILTQITGALREMVGSEELESDVITSLLRHKRLVLIFDALSERSEGTRQNVASIHQTLDANAIIVTTRQLIEFPGVSMTRVEPQRIAVDTVVYFVAEYLSRTGRAGLFPGRKPLELGERVLTLLEGQPVTPLFVTIFVDQASDLQTRGLSLDDLPTSIPEIVLEHIRRTNPQSVVSNDDLLAAAKRAGRASLGTRYVPVDFLREAVDVSPNLLDQLVAKRHPRDARARGQPYLSILSRPRSRIPRCTAPS